MQAIPPVPNLLLQLKTIASNVHNVGGLDNIDWRWKPKPDEWSLSAVFCHLRDVEIEIHQARFNAVLNGTNVFMVGVSADDWAASRNYQEQDGQKALREFLSARANTIALLDDLTPEMWERHGIHAFFGRTTMHELLFLVSRHDELHWEQINNILVKQQAGEAAS